MFVPFAKIRPVNAHVDDNSFYADRIIRMLVEEGLNHLPVVEKCAYTLLAE